MVPLVELKNVSYRLDEGRILDAIDWRIEYGQHWAVLGPNGAGKTTLLRMLCGELWPNDGGEIWRHGSSHFDLRRLRRSIGWLTTNSAARIPEHQTAFNTVLAGAFAQTRLIVFAWDPPSDAQRLRAQESLERLNVSHLSTRTFGTLSHGEQQRVLIARALMAEPDLLILDEPCAGLDPGARERLLLATEKLAKNQSPTLIITTHHSEEITPSFTRTLTLKAGRSLMQGRTEEVLNEATLSELYDGHFSLHRHAGRTWALGGG
ncbi:MAG: ATP-binding cassette domain-containing protein [Polyangiaceae bacterium]|nr:ATP-binding cassette domain-containing protein [Polyangiaceae bacterium]